MIDRILVPAHVRASWQGNGTYKQSFVHRIELSGVYQALIH